MKTLISKILLWMQDYLCFCFYCKQFRCYLRMHKIPNKKQVGEDVYIKKWQPLCSRVEPYSYRFFSHFCGNTPNIIPEDIGRQYIERTLNPMRYRYFYSDKNTYDMYIDMKYLPITYYKKSEGNGEYFTNKSINDLLMNIPANCNRLILKPSVDTCSGKGVLLFIRTIHNEWRCEKENVTLTDDFLNQYGNDYVLQEAVEQSDYMAQFCSTSVNTLRIATYRSVKDNEIHILGSIMRIGKMGEFVDNAHAGGMFVGINKENGKVGEKAYTAEGQCVDAWNGICFKGNSFVIPHWDKIQKLAKYVAGQNRHCHLLALDITIDKNSNPKLIECNVGEFSYWFFMLTGQTPFGKYTDEIIEYCKKNKHIRKQIKI